MLRREVVSLNPPVSESELLKLQIGLHHCAALVEKIEKKSSIEFLIWSSDWRVITNVQEITIPNKY
jgi:hypothetical protein